MTTKSDRLLRTAEAAELLDLKPMTLAKWRTAGAGPTFVKVGGAIRYRASDLAEFLATNTVKAAAQK